MYKNGGGPMGRLSERSREHRVGRQDRLFHEMDVLCHSLQLAGSCDQLNVGGLRCMERLVRRIQVITGACSEPGAPASWRMVRCRTGDSGPGDAAAPELRSFGDRRARRGAEFPSAAGR
eukprot:589569-Pyramimonas_sp.AAC.1